MRNLWQYLQRIVYSLLSICVIVTAASAHPGSGIVLDRQGNVYFVDTGHGVWKIDTEGRLLTHEGPAYHWMAIDLEGHFITARLPHSVAAEMTVVGGDPTLLVAGDFPVTVGRDGAVYYPEGGRDRHERVMRLTPSGTLTVFANLPDATDDAQLWLHGVAAGRDGSIYYTDRNTVRRISPQGTMSTIASNIVVPHCVRPPAAAEERLGPALRGLDIASDGTVYVAASGCCAVLRITPGGAITVPLRASSPWSPTGVAVAGDDLYVLEYLYIGTDKREDWIPRVRKLSPDGIVSLVATVQRR